MKVRCKSEYHNGPLQLHFAPGVFEVDDPVAEFLFRDSPESFEQVKEAPVQVEAHDKSMDAGDVENTAIQRAPKKKAR